jgi:hypothetical protein
VKEPRLLAGVGDIVDAAVGEAQVLLLKRDQGELRDPSRWNGHGVEHFDNGWPFGPRADPGLQGQAERVTQASLSARRPTMK